MGVLLMATQPEATTTAPQDQSELKFMVQRLYIKDLSFEAPNVPAIFQQQWHPELSLEIHTSNTKLEKDVYEVELHVTATVKNEGQVAFLVEIKQAGIFSIQGTEGPQLDHLLGSFCPNILFPYVRETITSEVIRASFPQLVLAPINFDAIYFQNLQAKTDAAKSTKEDVH
jgi:preprotein translocase subunit SecB